MTPSEIAKSYDQLADHWNSDMFPRANGLVQHERAIAFVKEKRFALDVGCGSSGRIIDLLTRHGFAVDGLDISERMIALAKQRHPGVRFHHADICAWAMPQRYDLISAWDSLWHLPLAHQKPVLHKIFQSLTPGGVCIFTAGGLDDPSEHVDSVMGPPLYYSTLGTPHILKLLYDSGCSCRHLEYDQYPESHLYLIVQRV